VVFMLEAWPGAWMLEIHAEKCQLFPQVKGAAEAAAP
jgi:hypothetical protein